MTESEGKPPIPKISIIAIGNELLVGSTRDINIFNLGKRASCWGLELKEAKIIRDEKEQIIHTLREQSALYDYVFTSGGIGPTHDDITAQAVSEAFDAPLRLNTSVLSAMEARHIAKGRKGALSEEVKKMAMIPEGGELIPNRISLAPGFRIQNVYVLAGVPEIFESMLDALEEKLNTVHRLYSREVLVFAGESVIAQKLEELQSTLHPVEIGSYPQQDTQGNYCVKAVWRGYEQRILNTGIEEFQEWLVSQNIKFDVKRGD